MKELKDNAWEHLVLKGEHVYLRVPVAEDIPEIIRFYRENTKHFDVFASPKPEEFYTAAHWEQQVETAHRNFMEDKAVNFFIWDGKEPRGAVGFANFFGIIRGAFHACYLGYGLSEQFVGRGLMTEALRLAIEFMFTDRNLHRIMANHAPHNFRSANVLRRLGFIPEGYARDYLLVHGAWQDHVLNVLTNDRWRPTD
jgi:[ribosomal protein S5]-alanine N-acetyltransferase